MKIVHIDVIVIVWLVALFELLFEQHLILFGSQQVNDALCVDAVIVEVNANNWIEILVAIEKEQCFALVIVGVGVVVNADS